MPLLALDTILPETSPLTLFRLSLSFPNFISKKETLREEVYSHSLERKKKAKARTELDFRIKITLFNKSNLTLGWCSDILTANSMQHSMTGQDIIEVT